MNHQYPQLILNKSPRIIYPKPQTSGHRKGVTSSPNFNIIQEIPLNSTYQNSPSTIKRCESLMFRLDAIERKIKSYVQSMQFSSMNSNKIASSISFLSSEVTQMQNKHTNLDQKLKSISKILDNDYPYQIQSMIQPLQESFKSFDNRFNESFKNIESIFSGLLTRSNIIQSDYETYTNLINEINNISPMIENLKQTHQNAKDNMKIQSKEFNKILKNRKNSLFEEYNNRKKKIEKRINELEKISTQISKKSQNLIIDSQNIEFELQKEFDEMMEKFENNFNEKFTQIKTRINKLNKQRRKEFERIRLQNENKEESQNDFNENKEIENLKQRIKKLKSKINEKESNDEFDLKEYVKFYYRIDEFGKYQCIITLDDGTVYC